MTLFYIACKYSYLKSKFLRDYLLHSKKDKECRNSKKVLK